MIPVNIAPKSDQLNADDLTPGTSIIVTVSGVKGGPDPKQSLDVQLVGHTRVYRPCLTMRRLLIACWGGVTDGMLDPAAWIGKRMELYNDTSVYFGADNTGGIRIRAMSGIREDYTIALTVKKGKRAAHTVRVLPPADPFVDALTALDLTIEDAADYLAAMDPPRVLAEMDHDGRRKFVGFARSEQGMAKIRAFLASTGGA